MAQQTISKLTFLSQKGCIAQVAKTLRDKRSLVGTTFNPKLAHLQTGKYHMLSVR